jgi:hypothetical protein
VLASISRGFTLLLMLSSFLLPISSYAQDTHSATFGCFDAPRTALKQKPPLEFSVLETPQAIKDWQKRPLTNFAGFDVSKYGWNQIRFYRWHVDAGHGTRGDRDYSDRLTLAVRLSGPKRDRWFELQNPKEFQFQDLLYIQPLTKESDTSTAQIGQSSENQVHTQDLDEMSSWLSIEPASPAASLPLFILRFSYHDSGANAEGTMDTQLLLDLRSGKPEIAASAQCIDWEGGGACGAPDAASAIHEQVKCEWDSAVADFKCTMVSGFGGEFPLRSSQRDFYLVSDLPAPADWKKDSALDVAALAKELQKNPKQNLGKSMVSDAGPTTLLAHFTDLLPQNNIYLFASPGPGNMLNSHLSLVSIPVDGDPSVQSIEKWDIGGATQEEGDAPVAFTPVLEDDAYKLVPLEDRPSFHALQITMTSPKSNDSHNPIHVVYWVGIESVDGKIVANAVRLASEAQSYYGCNQWLDDASAYSLQRKPRLAEAIIAVQPRDRTMLEESDTEATPYCLWTGSLHWKPGAGFRVRKLSQNCKADRRIITIADDGTISSKSLPRSVVQHP